MVAQISTIFLVLSSCCLATSAKGTSSAQISIDTKNFLSKTDDSYICVCVDWWPASKCDYGWCPWGDAGIFNLDLEHPGLVAGLKALSEGSPLHLRLGGSLEDTITYQVRGDEHCPEYKLTNTTRLGYSLDGPCLTMKRWKAIHQLCDTAGCDITFGVNALKGRKFHGCDEDPKYGHDIDCRNTKPRPACCFNFTTPWVSSNAEHFFKYTAEQLSQYSPPYALEFGNELAGHGGIQAQLSAEDYARDFKAFVGIVRQAWPVNTPKVIATDTAYDAKWASEFLDLAAGDVDIYTWHTYFLGAGVSPDLPSKVMSPSYLNKMKHAAAAVQKGVSSKAPHAQIWMGETGGAYNSGHPGVTDAFMSGFWYLDNLAVLAQRGHQAFCRQTLIGGNYGLLNTTSFQPNPDFYSALLFKRLMGQVVLNTTVTGPATLRAYAHCTRGDASKVTLLLLNMENDTSVDVDAFARHARAEYHLSSNSLSSQDMYLNGNRLVPGKDASIPELKPKQSEGGKLSLEPLTYAFVVLSDIHAPACSQYGTYQI